MDGQSCGEQCKAATRTGDDSRTEATGEVAGAGTGSCSMMVLSRALAHRTQRHRAERGPKTEAQKWPPAGPVRARTTSDEARHCERTSRVSRARQTKTAETRGVDGKQNTLADR